MNILFLFWKTPPPPCGWADSYHLTFLSQDPLKKVCYPFPTLIFLSVPLKTDYNWLPADKGIGIKVKCFGWFRNRNSANCRLPACYASLDIWNNNLYQLTNMVAIALSRYPGTSQSSWSLAFAKRITTLGTRLTKELHGIKDPMKLEVHECFIITDSRWTLLVSSIARSVCNTGRLSQWNVCDLFLSILSECP